MIYEFNGYKPVVDPSSFVHKEATIIGNVIIGQNVYIGPGASLRGDWGQIIVKDGCNNTIIISNTSYWYNIFICL